MGAWAGYPKLPHLRSEGSALDSSLAIESARGSAGSPYRDGISYLKNALAAGVRTTLADDYARQVLEQTGAPSLDEAWKRVRGLRLEQEGTR